MSSQRMTLLVAAALVAACGGDDESTRGSAGQGLTGADALDTDGARGDGEDGAGQFDGDGGGRGESGVDDGNGDDAGQTGNDSLGAATGGTGGPRGGDGPEGDGGSAGDDEGNDVDDEDVGGSSGGEPELTCEQGAYAFDVEAQPPNVMLVLDKSGSMRELFDSDGDGTADISRWSSLYSVVSFLTNRFEGQVNFGAQLFPNAASSIADLENPDRSTACPVLSTPEVAVGPNSGADILASIPGPGAGVDGGTPAADGLLSAIDHLETLDSDASRAIVLITDGAPNCRAGEPDATSLTTYDDDVVGVIRDAFEVYSIPVYVVGINIRDFDGFTRPAVNPYVAITDMALAGGAPSAQGEPFFNAFNGVELADALENVIEEIECSINLTDVPDQGGSVSVALDGQELPVVSDCSLEDGWRYTTDAAPYNAIQLCGSACQDLQDGGLINVEYVCPG